MPPSLTDQAERLRKLAGNLKDRGLVDVAVELLEIALDLQAQSLTGGEGGSPARLREAESSASFQDVTGAQLQRRGRAIAKAKARDQLLAAITRSKWENQETYCRKRLRISSASLSAYRSGVTHVPRTVADMVMADFGIPHSFWPLPVVE